MSPVSRTMCPKEAQSGHLAGPVTQQSRGRQAFWGVLTACLLVAVGVTWLCLCGNTCSVPFGTAVHKINPVGGPHPTQLAVTPSPSLPPFFSPSLALCWSLPMTPGKAQVTGPQGMEGGP